MMSMSLYSCLCSKYVVLYCSCELHTTSCLYNCDGQSPSKKVLWWALFNKTKFEIWTWTCLGRLGSEFLLDLKLQLCTSPSAF
jgi:hypothetical protein